MTPFLKPIRAALCLASLLPVSALADAVVTFNEVNYNPVGNQDGEWIELHNQMSVNIDLSGWQLADGVSFKFAKGTVIPAGGNLIVAKNPANPALAGVSQVLGPFSGSLSNSGETIDLLSRAGRLMDRLTYSDHGEWPLAADGAGTTLAKRVPGSDSENPASWTAGPTLGGTPGAANFPTGISAIQHALVPTTAIWKFRDTNTAPPAGWTAVSFNDGSWSLGTPVFGTTGTEPVLTVTADLVSRYRVGAITGTANGGIPAQWSDTATGDGISQDANVGGNPTYRTNATPSGQPAVRFDGNDQYRASLPPGISASSGFVYFIVCKANGPPVNGGVADGAGNYIFDRDITNTDLPLISLKAVNNRYGFQKRDNGNSSIGGPVSTTPISTTQFQIVAVRRNPAAARYEIWVDGVMENSIPDEGDDITPQPIVIGNHANAGTNGFNGDIAELLIYKNALTESEFQNVGAYLESRYGLATAFPGTAVSTSLSAATATNYFRKSFTFAGNPANTELRLDSTIADGAIFYLNGQEISRTNLPAGPISHGTQALADIPQPVPTGYQTVSSSALVAGPNVLAVSLHKAAGSPSSFFTASLAGTEQPPDPSFAPDLKINEIAAVTDPAFFIELRNEGKQPVSTTGFNLAILGGASYALPTASIAPGGMISFSAIQLGWVPAADDKIVLSDAASHIADVQLAATTPGGRSADHPEEWLHPSAPTPGATNQFNLATDIVINEICYKAPELPAVPGTPPTQTTVAIVSYNSQWRFNQANASLPAGWAAVAHSVGNGWQSGPGALAYTTNTLPISKGTILTNPTLNSPRVVTYYFESDFTLSAPQAANLSTLTLSHVIDDGAVFYLNGVEIARYNMPAGPITSATFSSTGIATPAIVSGVIVTVPPGAAVTGTNRLSVEVHQNSTASSDVVFGLQATGTVVTDPGIPAIPATPSNQQWIELRNKGNATIDLTGWKLASGIDYTFPAATSMAPGAFLVISRDGLAPPAAPALAVLGPWSGKLSSSGERILLLDAVGNPADDVHFSDGGRWPATPDGDGTSLELRDPRSDNALGDSWSASDETTNRSWETFTYQGVAAASAVGPDNQWREFIFGLINEGEVLIDDLAVTENPGSTNVAMIAGGNFENGTTGWRFLGNHSNASIITDPTNPSNHVLYLKATGATEHMHNHVEKTLSNSRSVVNGRTYRISFRARWLSGCNKLNTRLYFNRLARTTELTRRQPLGTPGAANSTAIPNAGPGFTSFSHSPAVPEPGQLVTVTARANDPDGMGTLKLRYSRDGQAFVELPMTRSADGTSYGAQIPGFTAASVVRFYIEAKDAAVVPATSWFPAAGPEAHALYQVNDGLAAINGLNNVRIVMDPVDKALLYRTNNVMSNDRIGCTVIYNESEIYYEAGIRLKSSQRGRQNSARVGFNLSFNPDQLFRGSLKNIAIDRSEGQITGAQEILYDQMMYASGGIPGEFNDLCKVIAPDPAHTSTAILQPARYGSDYLDSQFDKGADGTVYEYELVYYPTTADANGYKLPQPDSVVGVGFTTLGSDPENYRWTYLTKNSEDKNDYSRVIAMASLFDQSGATFDSTVNDVLDVDQWLRALAYSCATGAGDSFYVNSHHNGQFYARPSDGRMLYFPHDLDYAYNQTLGIFVNTELQKLTVDPSRKRAYLGHLYNICTTVFNRSYMSAWTAHFGGLLPNEDFPGHLNYIDGRSTFILGQINASIAPVTFAISTNGGADFASPDSPVELAGQGWIDVREIRLAGSTAPLPVKWTSQNTWETSVPLDFGINVIHLEAIDFEGNVVGTDSITVTNSGNIQLPSPDNLVMSEIYYKPILPYDTDEYVELMNVSSNAAIDLGGLSFTEGIVYTFPAGTQLQPGARIVVAADRAAFTAEFGSGVPVAVGSFTGGLKNSGERFTLRRADNVVVLSFVYSDSPPWPTLPDTAGNSLVLIDPYSLPNHDDPLSWRASVLPRGTPGTSDSTGYAAWKAAYGNPADGLDNDGDGRSTFFEYFLGSDPTLADAGPMQTFNLETDGDMLLSIDRRVDVSGITIVPEISTTLGI